MADIAAVFHWSPSELERMDLADLSEWRERARARLEMMAGIWRPLI